MRALFDTNVLLDVLLDREPYAEASAELLSSVARGRLRGYGCATSLTTIFYLARRAARISTARKQLRSLLSILEVAPVDRAVIEAALGLSLADFEDAVVASSALAIQADVLVTRDGQLRRRAPLAAMTPEELVAFLDASAEG